MAKLSFIPATSVSDFSIRVWRRVEEVKEGGEEEGEEGEVTCTPRAPSDPE